jgi:hypothetical protein
MLGIEFLTSSNSSMTSSSLDSYSSELDSSSEELTSDGDGESAVLTPATAPTRTLESLNWVEVFSFAEVADLWIRGFELDAIALELFTLGGFGKEILAAWEMLVTHTVIWHGTKRCQ